MLEILLSFFFFDMFLAAKLHLKEERRINGEIEKQKNQKKTERIRKKKKVFDKINEMKEKRKTNMYNHEDSS